MRGVGINAVPGKSAYRHDIDDKKSVNLALI
jgi:hypothetical protein